MSADKVYQRDQYYMVCEQLGVEPGVYDSGPTLLEAIVKLKKERNIGEYKLEYIKFSRGQGQMDLNLSMHEARCLYDQLHQIFGEKTPSVPQTNGPFPM